MVVPTRGKGESDSFFVAGSSRHKMPGERQPQDLDRPRVPLWALEVLQALGIMPEEASVVATKLYEGVMSEVHELVDPSGRRVVKLYRFDLLKAATVDTDPRYEAASRWLSLPPFFASTRERLDELRARSPVLMPEILAEGRLPCGLWYTAMLPLEGTQIADVGQLTSSQLRQLSRVMGELLRRLHEGGTRSAVPWRDQNEFVEEWAQIWHCLLDGLPEFTVGDRDRRNLMHQRVHELLERTRLAELGPTVLAHGDFGPTNVKFSEGGEPCALLDFQLCTPALAFMDFRWLHLLDRSAFLNGYGWPADRQLEAGWLGGMAHVFWEAMALVMMHRFAEFVVPERYLKAGSDRFLAGLSAVEAHPAR